jgi:hypothetical protein
MNINPNTCDQENKIYSDGENSISKMKNIVLIGAVASFAVFAFLALTF